LFEAIARCGCCVFVAGCDERSDGDCRAGGDASIGGLSVSAGDRGCFWIAPASIASSGLMPSIVVFVLTSHHSPPSSGAMSTSHGNVSL
jgi:hypothetical protein